MEITATYEHGILKPLQPLNFKEHQRITILIHANAEWQRRLRNLLKSVYQHTSKFTSASIEKDITAAYREVKRSRYASKSSA